MAYNYEYPYTDPTRYNADWIIAAIKNLNDRFIDFIKVNTIKYANPIEWAINKQYEANTVVIDEESGNAYLSVKEVPNGISIFNTEYWSPIFNYTFNMDILREQITKANEKKKRTASAERNKGDLVWLSDELYRITTLINIGAEYIEGYNCEHITIEDIFKEIFTLLLTLKIRAGIDNDNWVSSLRGEQYDNDTIIAISQNGKTGLAGFTRTKDNEHSFDQGTIAVTGIARSDKTVSDNCVSWAGYFEGRRIGDSSSCFGVEIDSGRFGSNQELFNPYDEINNNNNVTTLNISSGCGEKDSNGADSAIIIHKNPKPFKQGIVFQHDAVENNRPAIALPWSSRISWQAGTEDKEMMQFATGSALYLSEITPPYYPLISLNNTNNLTADVEENAILGSLLFKNNGAVRCSITGINSNDGSIIIKIGDKNVTINKYWLDLPNMRVNAQLVIGESAFVDKSLNNSIVAHEAPTSTVKAIANELKTKLKPYWVNNKCSLTVKRDDIITTFSNHGWNALETNILIGDSNEYVNSCELANWLAYAD